jgi:propanediol dehydratase small subunit
LATVDDHEVMSLYEALRPHRSTAQELEELRASLQAKGATRCAELVRQAAVVYARRGLLR